MITATRILSAGSWTGPAADTLVLDRDDRHRRRLVMRCTGKTVFLLDLPEARVLKDGDALELEDGRLVAVKAVPERLLEVTAETPAALVRIAYHLGNRHLPVEFQGERLLIREDHVIEAMLGGLGAIVRHVLLPFDPESGAYASHEAHGHAGHDHAHHHAHGEECCGHDHDHEHGHDHGHEHGHEHVHADENGPYIQTHGPDCGCGHSHKHE